MKFRTERLHKLKVKRQLIQKIKTTLLLGFACVVLFICVRNTIADELSEREIYTKARQATVYIQTDSGQGSGFFVKPNLIATNFHVIEDVLHRPWHIKYRREGQKRLTIVKSVLGHNRRLDLAILNVTSSSITPLDLGDSDSVGPPDTVYVAGHPASIPKVTFTKGNISAIREDLFGRPLQFTAPISGGSSGGPIFNDRGKVIGVATWTRKSELKIKPKEIEVDVPQNLNLAIPSKHLRKLLEDLGVQIPTEPEPPDPDEERRRKAARAKSEIIEQLKTATVHIYGTDRNGNEGRLGSGFFVHEDQVATDFHVVDGSTFKGIRGLERGATSAVLLPAEQHPKTDKKHHLAILKIDKADVGPLSLGNSDEVVIGGEIYMVGDPAIGEVSEGNISDILEKDNVRYFEFDAKVSPGSSGGPIVNTNGQVIAVAALEVQEFSGTLKYAIPVNYLKGLLKGQGDSPNIGPDDPKDPPPPIRRPIERGIELYKAARYLQAVEYLQSVLNRHPTPKNQSEADLFAEAHLYLGFCKWGLEESKSSVRADFREALRYNPSVELPTDIVGLNHPVFKPILVEVREESTGTLKIIAVPPETKIQIYGGAAQPKLTADRTKPLRLFKGYYAVEGKLDHRVKVEEVHIMPGHHKELPFEMPAAVSPSHEFELTLDLFGAEKPNQVMVHYTIFDASGNLLSRGKKEMRLLNHKLEFSIWVYHVSLPAVNHGSRIVYRIEADGKIIRDDPPQIEILEPPEGALIVANQTIPIKARVISNVEISEVRVIYDAPTTLADTSPSQKLEKESSSNTYKGKIATGRRHTDGTSWFYISATNKEGIKVRSATRAVRTKPPEPDSLTITLESVPDSLQVNRPINITAEVKSGSPLREVRVYYDFPRKQLTESSPSTILEDKKPGTYVGRIPKERTREAGYIWYFVSATTANEEKFRSEDRVVEVKDSATRTHQGVWASHSWSNLATNDGFYSGWERGNVLSLAFLSEGKGSQILGVQLDYTYDNPDYISATAQWGPSTRENPVAFALLAGATGNRSSDPSFSRVRQSRQFTPLLGGSVKFYPLSRVAIDVTGSVKLQSNNGAADRESSFTEDFLHHYEAGIRLYISPTLNLRAGYGRWRLGEYDSASVQVGLGATF